MSDYNYPRIEDLVVYQKLYRLHIEVCALTHRWPAEEKYELGTLERFLPERDRRWPERKGEESPELRVQEAPAEYCADAPPGYPDP